MKNSIILSIVPKPELGNQKENIYMFLQALLVAAGFSLRSGLP
jgi:hypothetical protein